MGIQKQTRLGKIFPYLKISHYEEFTLKCFSFKIAFVCSNTTAHLLNGCCIIFYSLQTVEIANKKCVAVLNCVVILNRTLRVSLRLQL